MEDQTSLLAIGTSVLIQVLGNVQRPADLDHAIDIARSRVGLIVARLRRYACLALGVLWPRVVQQLVA